ncbi:MAG TPA: glycerol-3-phosphate cytidylyltransferase, partial [Flavobacteriaceae bacterium]|nr:glycerol-3-phosphate cytidylyltransferase [Flavobacteriaceae bacterium]
MKTIITYGTFDMFHIGHLKLLQRLKDMADEL